MLNLLQSSNRCKLTPFEFHTNIDLVVSPINPKSDYDRSNQQTLVARRLVKFNLQLKSSERHINIGVSDSLSNS